MGTICVTADSWIDSHLPRIDILKLCWETIHRSSVTPPPPPAPPAEWDPHTFQRYAPESASFPCAVRKCSVWSDLNCGRTGRAARDCSLCPRLLPTWRKPSSSAHASVPALHVSCRSCPIRLFTVHVVTSLPASEADRETGRISESGPGSERLMQAARRHPL